MYKNYRKKSVQPMRPYVEGENLTGVSISGTEVPGPGGMVAYNPKDPEDKWYVSKDFFLENYVECTPPAVPPSASTGEEQIEKEIQEKGLTAPRITPDLINRTIVAEDYHVFDGTYLTVCCLTLQNGFTVLGESACVSPENFDAEVGQKIAYANAREKIWALEGYLLKQARYAHS